MTHKHDAFVLSVLDYVDQATAERAWAHDSWTEAVKILRFEGKHVFTLMEAKVIMCDALEIPVSERGWDAVALKWNTRNK
jgi:hypothetical protein